jgi:hypothetical protein
LIDPTLVLFLPCAHSTFPGELLHELPYPAGKL